MIMMIYTWQSLLVKIFERKARDKLVILFRVDASHFIGTGHLMRCLTLAEEMTKNGAICHFLSIQQPGSLNHLIIAKGYSLHFLASNSTGYPTSTFTGCDGEVPFEYSDWLRDGWEKDAQESLKVVSKINPDWLIIDHYGIDERWESDLKRSCSNIMVIDDLANRRHNCKILLDQTFKRSSEDYKTLVGDGVKLLCGSKYAILRPEFLLRRDESLLRRQNPKLSNLLITMGGVDRFDATSEVLNALCKAELPNAFEITVVMGKEAPWLKKVQSLAQELPWDVNVLNGVEDMAEIMTFSDLAICAGGSTVWECCCLGLPSIIVVVAENQRDGCMRLTSNNLVRVIDSIGQVKNELKKNLKFFIRNVTELSKYAENMKTVTNGFGVKIVCETILNRRGVTVFDV